ncbi:hypothetical protein Sste5346_008990 [Sporothrix stenoceras]|uniref:Uncharacterized protein n=1 Tax=Sporothrix stenoceras TaxID=5173 RepID=A0ABR3YN93_9PEZI
MGSPVVIVLPVRPAALLSHILEHCTYPTTLVICSTSTDFVQRCANDAGQHGDTDGSVLHTASLLQVAVARHIRVAFVPTVAHLRGFLAALDLKASRVPAPPTAEVLLLSGGAPPPARRGDHTLVVYDFLRLHRDTSEWSSQGLSASAAVLVEAGWRTRLEVLVVDGAGGQPGETATTTTALDEKMPVLSTGPRRQLQRAGYPLRSERIRAVLSRWFSFRDTLEAPKEERPAVESMVEEEQPRSERDATVGPVEVKELKETDETEKTEKVEEAREVPVAATENEDEAGTIDVDDVPQASPRVDETIRVPEEKPRRTFVKDSEDEDDDLSDDGLYP